MNASKFLSLLSCAPLVVAAACSGGGASAGPSRALTTRGAPATPGVAATPSQAGGQLAPVPEGPRVQRTARITLDVATGHFDSTLNDVISVVDQAGGYISGSQAQADQGQPLRSGEATFQVPDDKFDAVLGAIRRKGTPETISIEGNDVSGQYVDLQARLRNAEAQRDATLALMQQAKSISDTIQIENQLGQVTGQIEELQGQIDFLDHSTTYATVSVTIQEVAATADPWGLQTAGAQALHNLVGVLDFLILALGTLMPVVIAGLGAAAVAWRLWPRLRRGGAAPAPRPVAK